MNAESVPLDIQKKAERLRTGYLQEALGRMVMADHEYRKTCKKVEETDADLSQLSVDTLLSGVRELSEGYPWRYSVNVNFVDDL